MFSSNRRPTAVVPMPWHVGSASERWYTAALAAFIAATSCSCPGAGAGSPVLSEWTIVRIAMSEATCPDACPPIPSHTTYTPRKSS
jgi:hypothetical protein